jgi:uncharacterized membrane protein
MPSAARTFVVKRPVQDVFAFFTEPANDMKWREHVKEISAENIRRGVGTRIHQVIAGPGGRAIAADIEVTLYDKDLVYGFSVVQGPVRPEGRFDFQEIDEHTTEVTFTLRAELGGLKKLFMSGPVQKSMDGEMANLDKAKQLLESSATS